MFIRRTRLVCVIAAFSLLFGCNGHEPPETHTSSTYSVEEKSITDLQADLTAGLVSSEQLVALYLQRIDAIDRHGPQLQSVIAVNPEALNIARALDAERRSQGSRGPLHGIPLLLKDNIESADPIATTAGSLALRDNITNRDAPLVKRLRDAGAIILGKTNLSEWANIRSSRSVSGWSAVGGLTRNPYATDRNTCGSSSGSGVAAAASLAAATIGTETDGSVTCPSAINGIVGLKPTVGLVSRTHIVPISHSQDTAGPMARTVRDAAILLAAMAGSDANDPATIAAEDHQTDFVAQLQSGALAGKRLGIMRFASGYHPELDQVFERSLTVLQAAGAELVEIKSFPDQEKIGQQELLVLLTELKVDLNRYLQSTPAKISVHSLADVIAFNRDHADKEMTFFGQELFEQAEQTKGDSDPEYLAAKNGNILMAGKDGLMKLLTEQKLDAFIAPTTGPAWTTDVINGDHYLGAASSLPAIAGYPHLTIPMGYVKGLPVGISFIGPAWSDAALLAMGYDFEQRTAARHPPTYVLSNQLSDIAGPLQPAKTP